ncbi:putative tail fiber protein [Agrobacterium phage OLIVR2]|uniref:Putative tail fiber protein n=1 Tax=Agrobacterium phage OLIVR1 TaxID=2723769 RepID=A0A858MR94_9CAUD|nr:hypothetical protein [Xanthomonas campestris]YP_010107136.1 minor tail protein [Agrobacterium phage OLIVR1]QIW87404.1 putative tail fiber protein [Agrobacterium phage OLIVR2]QIW87511.1 putative tail fiber protein [Agrobacterium phage OLIVR3]MCF8861601.1 hypothetical protein [Xanthomonas campestris pv. campestris]QIW87297.1 putative tail fiber protein [Agrobacterium phage OLIVR1]
MSGNPFGGDFTDDGYAEPSAPSIPAGNVQPELVVDRILRTSYEVVRYVAQHIQQLNLISAQIDALIDIQQNLDNLQGIIDNITDIKLVAENLDSVEQIVSALPELVAVYSNLDELLQIIPQTEELVQSAQIALNETIEIRDGLLADITAEAQTLDVGEQATAIYDPVTKKITLGIPVGATGLDAWTAVVSNVMDGPRAVQRVVDWFGGSGVKPPVGMYISETGYTHNIGEATNIRGASGTGTGDMLSALYDPQNIKQDVFDRANHTGSQSMSTITGLEDAFSLCEKAINKGASNGYASLDINSKVPLSQINEALIGAMNYQGTWDASANDPEIPAASPANKGWYYVINTPGTTIIDDFSEWSLGDWIVSNGSTWDKIDSSDQVLSVNGMVGTVVLNKSHVGLENVPNKTEAQMVESGAIADALATKATSIQGSKADTAVQPGDLGNAATSNFFYGTGVPSDSFGSDGDLYFQYDA